MEANDTRRRDRHRFELDPGGVRRERRAPSPAFPYAIVYLLGMAVATTSGSAFVIGGMLAGSRGLTAVALAAAVPMAGLLWAITLSLLHRGHGRPRPVTGRRPGGAADR